MSYWHELERECKELREQVAALTEENDLQRQSIQDLSAQVVAYRNTLSIIANIETKKEQRPYGTVIYTPTLESVQRFAGQILALPNPVAEVNRLLKALAALEGDNDA